MYAGELLTSGITYSNSESAQCIVQEAMRCFKGLIIKVNNILIGARSKSVHSSPASPI